MEFEFNGKYRYISVEKLTYDSGRMFYDIDHYILDNLSQTKVEDKNMGDIVAVNFLTTGLIDILFKQHKSLGQLTFLLTSLLYRALKVPLNRHEQAFHCRSIEFYQEQLNMILEKLNSKTFESKEDLRVFIVKNICELWD